MSVDLADRYGTQRPRQRLLLIVVSVLVAVVFLVWLAWVAWFHANPNVSSELNTYSILDAHSATVEVTVDLGEDATDVNCRVRAASVDHVTVGERNFEPTDGRNKVTIRTEREASSIDLVGCTAKGQSRPQ